MQHLTEAGIMMVRWATIGIHAVYPIDITTLNDEPAVAVTFWALGDAFRPAAYRFSGDGRHA